MWYVALDTSASLHDTTPENCGHKAPSPKELLASLKAIFPGDFSGLLSLFSGQVSADLGCQPPSVCSQCHSDLLVFCKRSLEQSLLENNVENEAKRAVLLQGVSGGEQMLR